MYLLLLRHGIAEAKDLPKPDEDRLLSSEGKRALRAFYPLLIEHVLVMLAESGGEVEIWSSPKLRAIQTAELLAEQSGWPVADPILSLATDDIQAFHQELLNRKDLTLIIAAGHEPGLGRWTSQISTRQLHFKKGGVAALSLNLDAEELVGDFLWYIEPERESKTKKGKKKENRAKPSSNLKKSNPLQKAFREIEREEARFRAHSDDPDAAHKLRVRTRALRSLLNFYKPLLKKKDYQHIQAGLRESAARVGRLRELDVLIQNYEQARQHLSEGQGEQSALLSYLLSERKAEAKALLSQIKDGSLKKKRRPAQRFIQGLESFSDIEFEKKRFNQWRRQIDSSIDHVADLPYEALHELRIKTKKVRYVLEALEYLLPRIRDREIRRLSDLQDKLGDLCDNHRNRDILAEMLVLNQLDQAKLEISSYMSQLNIDEHHIMQTIQE